MATGSGDAPARGDHAKAAAGGGRKRGRPRGDNPRKALVREQLIDKATEIFRTKGYAQTSINDIAAELGLQRSSVYHYFANKEEVLAALIEKESSKPYDDILRVLMIPDLSARERLRRVVSEGVVRRLTGSPRFLVLHRLEAEMPPDLAALYNRSRRRIFDLYTRVIAEGVKAGEFREMDASVAAFAVIGMANWTSWWYSPKGKLSPEQIADAIVDFALNGLARAPQAGEAVDSLGAAIRALKDNILLLERLAR